MVRCGFLSKTGLFGLERLPSLLPVAGGSVARQSRGAHRTLRAPPSGATCAQGAGVVRRPPPRDAIGPKLWNLTRLYCCGAFYCGDRK
jgi:hypothetical protein